jgi:hypothetical protein
MNSWGVSETLVPFYHYTRLHISEDSTLFYTENRGSRLVRIIATFLPDFTASHRTRPIHVKWRERQKVYPKRWYIFTRLYGGTSYKSVTFSSTLTIEAGRFSEMLARSCQTTRDHKFQPEHSYSYLRVSWIFCSIRGIWGFNRRVYEYRVSCNVTPCSLIEVYVRFWVMYCTYRSYINYTDIVLLEKLIVAQQVNPFPAPYETEC